ncbi:hypothetical protein KUG88_02475 [Rhodococcus rhodochrous]|uniref:hypothetical protein n=1 Tax=Rhodococcus rhodochrous TaxID=1829 RepID=UPI001E541F4D|nr:hypothetical protein [Rhodococcus rhodochrous]MCB8909001.1 hypothetical protein [Rhodococcus rhodochrous]
MTILPTWLYDKVVDRFGQDWVEANGYVRNTLHTPTPEVQYRGDEAHECGGFTIPIHDVSREAIEGSPVDVLEVIRQRIREEGQGK